MSLCDWSSDVCSSDLRSFILDRARLEPLMKLRRNRPLLLIDIAVPRDIEPEINFLENVYLYNIDDLQAIADDYLKQRQVETVRCEAIIREKAQALAQGFGGGDGVQCSVISDQLSVTRVARPQTLNPEH